MKNYILTAFVMVFGVLAMLGSASNQSVNPPSAASTDFTFENTTTKAVVDQLVSLNMSNGLTVTNATDYMVIAQGLDRSMGAMMLYGSKYDRVPALRLTYNIGNLGDGRVRVIGKANMITNPGSAHEQSSDFTSEMSGHINGQLMTIRNQLQTKS
ncbi:hypothetical protein [Thiocapsa roseopersicina]|uniref:hypothetical protein n=1 Tax=Thiocapsa roseopersicina TaxID=1058 RepID=UPI0011134081|nr:hypothetical protein [Thiocapsa roseopersicina]NCA87190.1 hypothetical protein [Clostridia bacterium]